MTSAFRVVCSIGVSIAVLGCAGHDNTPTAPRAPAEDVSPAAAAPGPDYVATPAGWFHRSCVHEVPAGARVSPANIVTRSDGGRYQIPACGYRAFPNFGHASRRARRGTPTNFEPPSADTGWVEFAFDILTSDVYRDLAATWKVPASPVNAYSGTKVFYQFPGLQNNAFIVQPVIQYGYNGAFGGNFWTAASWHCDGPSGICDHSTPITLSSADSIFGTADASACASGICTWTITTVDVTKATQTSLTVSDSDNYQFATGGAMETHGSFTSCGDFPASGTQFFGISLYNQTGQTTPSWTPFVVSSPSPSCGFAITSTTDSVHTIVNPPPPPGPMISINGPTLIRPGATCIWSAGVSGGTSPYTYDWHMGTTDVGSDAVLETAKPVGLPSTFILHLDVTGADGGHSSTSVSVTESSTARICPN